MTRLSLYVFWLGSLIFSASCAHAIDFKEIEQKLATTGAEGEVHGSAVGQGLFVFTYRNPTDFFDYVEMSLVSYEPAVTTQLGTLNRHDRIRVKGSFLKNPSPQKHIKVTSLDVIKKYSTAYPSSSYSYEARLPDELLNQDSADFIVHAVHSDGHVLVVEYKDAVLPIFVQNGALTEKLYRGDIVKLSIGIQTDPDRPMHLKLNETAPQPVQVLEAIKDKHGKKGSIEGALVLFPKSPIVKFNIFAVLEELQSGLKRQYTLVNFEDPALFTKIREALQKAWDRHPTAYVNGRNKLISTRVRVKATGIFNEVDPNQANPQILLNSLDSIEILEK